MKSQGDLFKQTVIIRDHLLSSFIIFVLLFTIKTCICMSRLVILKQMFVIFCHFY